MNDLIFVGDIPASRPGFQPRPALLAQLSRAGPGQPVVLTGTRGVGKTQLAAAYARAKLADRWRLVAWVNARDPETLIAGMEAVADATGLSAGGSAPGPADAGQTVRDWLEADGSHRLLVFDDVADPGLLRPFVPTAGESQVLITATGGPTTELGTPVPVGAFSAEESLALLDGRTGLVDEDGALAVAVQLGYLPLSLDQAAAMIAKQHSGYAAYLAKLRALSADDRLIPDKGEEQQPPPPPGMTEAVLLAMEAASAADRVGVSIRVLELITMLAPAVVRRELLHAAGQAGTLLGGGRRVAASMVDQALERLNERSLLGFSLDGQAVSVHCLAARVIRAELARQGRFTAACGVAAAAVEGSVAAFASPVDHRAVREMIAQVTALAENAEAAPGGVGEPVGTMLALLRSFAFHHLTELGHSMPHAIAMGEPLIADLEQRLGPDDSDTVRARNDLARAYRETDRIADAVPLVEKIHAARQRLFGANHPSTLASRNNLASAYLATGESAEAIPLFEENVAACERQFGADHPKTLASRHKLDLARQELARDEIVPEEPAQEEPEPPELASGEPESGPAALEDPATWEPKTAEGTEAAGDLEPASEAEAAAADEVTQVTKTVPEPAAAREPEGDASEDEVTQQTQPVQEPAMAREPADEASREPAPPPAPEPAVPRPDPAGSGRPAARGGMRLPWIAGTVALLVVASGVAGALTRLHHGGHAASGAGASSAPPADAAQAAADWVSRQVSRSVTVGCDPMMCASLKARGVPMAKLLVLRAGTASPRGAGVVVATPAIRSQFGSRLDSQYAPSVIAGFGSGPARVDVRVVAPDGAGAYLAALRQDQAARKVAGAQLLANRQIRATTQARAQLAAGSVDSRLLITLPALAATHPIQILAFGDSGPGAGPDAPLCQVDLSGSGRAAGMTDADYSRWLTSFVRAQLDRFAGSVAVIQPGGQPAVRVEFDRPSPLGLLVTG
jgi:hypothetical protein